MGVPDLFLDLKYHDKHPPEQEWPSKVRIVDTTQPLLPPKIRAGVLEAVSNALYENKWLKLNYKNVDGKRGNYRVMPLGLAQQGPRLYLICRFQDFDNERSLASIPPVGLIQLCLPVVLIVGHPYAHETGFARAKPRFTGERASVRAGKPPVRTASQQFSQYSRWP